MAGVVVRLEEDAASSQARELCAVLLDAIEDAATLVPVFFSFGHQYLEKTPSLTASDVVKRVTEQSSNGDVQRRELGTFSKLASLLNHCGDVVLLATSVRRRWFSDTKDIGPKTARPHVVLVSFGGPLAASSPHTMRQQDLEHECDLFNGSVTQLDLSSTYTQLKRSPTRWQQLMCLTAALPSVLRSVTNVMRHLSLGSLTCPVAFFPSAATAPAALALQLQQPVSMNILAFVPVPTLWAADIVWSTRLYLSPTDAQQRDEQGQRLLHLLASTFHEQGVCAAVALGTSLMGVLSLPATETSQPESQKQEQKQSGREPQQREQSLGQQHGVLQTQGLVLSVLAEDQSAPGARHLLAMFSSSTHSAQLPVQEPSSATAHLASTTSRPHPQQHAGPAESMPGPGLVAAGATQESHPSYMQGDEASAAVLDPAAAPSLERRLSEMEKLCGALPAKADQLERVVDHVLGVARTHALPDLREEAAGIVKRCMERQQHQGGRRTRGVAKGNALLSNLLARIQQEPGTQDQL